MAAAKKIEDRTNWFIGAYKKLEEDKRLPSNVELAKIMGMRNKSTVTNILKRQQNIQPEQLRRFKAHFAIEQEGSHLSEPISADINLDKEKPGSIDYRAKFYDAYETIKGYNEFLQRMMESSFAGLLDRQEGGTAITIELLKRDALREAKGNPEKAHEILGEILRRIGPSLSRKMKEGIDADGHM
ncbi:MAG TPA: hypothetical protein VFE32_17165 [Puia sp.]|nr:hypothetical protein [Puia sp.]